nr:MAG TPA: hypothetical protein [Caudoviricetes sp.]
MPDVSRDRALTRALSFYRIKASHIVGGNLI